MILNPAYSIVAGPSVWDALPDTALWWAPRREVSRRPARPEELAGLGSFFKKIAQTVSKIAIAPIKLVSPKLASNLQKIDNKIISNVDSVATKVNDAAKSAGKFVAKNWKWVVVVAAIAITIYTMGAGSTIAAHMLSGMQALGAHVAAGASTVWHAVVGGSAVASTGATAATAATGAAAGAATATATTSAAGWLATTGKLALTAATALYNKAKVSDLSQQQAQAMLQAQASGYDLGAGDPQLQQALQTRAALEGAGVPTDANGQPLIDGPVETPAGALTTQMAAAAKAAADKAAASKDPFVALTSSPYFMPVAIGAGALVLVLLLRR